MKATKFKTSAYHYLTCKTLRIILFFIGLVPALLTSQFQPKALDSSKYHMWNETVIRKVSPDGNWFSFLLTYESRKDTLFVKSLCGAKAYSFPRSLQGEFMGSNFICQKNDSLVIQNLKDGTSRTLPGIKKFKITADSRYLVLLRKTGTGTYSLLAEDSKGSTVYSGDNISDFDISDKGGRIVISSIAGNRGIIRIMDLDKTGSPKKILETDSEGIPKFSWKNDLIAIILKGKQGAVLYSYDEKKQLLKECPFGNSQAGLSGMKISYEAYRSMLTSQDGSKIFFRISEPPQPENKQAGSAEIWNAADRRLYAKRKRYGSDNSAVKTAAWNIRSGIVHQITTRENPVLFLNGTQTHAFIYNNAAYEPQMQMTGPVDLYAVDLQSGEQSEAAVKIPLSNYPDTSPDGRYFAYFKDRQLWLYSIGKKQASPLLNDSAEQFLKEEKHMPGDPSHWGIAGWSADSRLLLIYDEFDLWQIEISSLKIKRLTFGRENRQVFRLSKPLFETGPAFHELQNKPALMLDKEVLLTVRNDSGGLSGFYSLKAGKQPRKIVWTDMKITMPVVNSKGDYMYLAQRFDSPASIMRIDPKGIHKAEVKTNTQHGKYEWGKAELIHYAYQGKPLSGVLYTPPGFQKGRKYPMIVYIYEKQSHMLHFYHNPTLHSSDGFNIPHLLSKGYFILLPDISFQFGALNKSVPGSVLAAVDKVLEQGTVDGSKLGLMGHSFGGYEANLIITQTGRFAAAISGAGWSDLVSSYLYMGTTLSLADYYRAESDQLRIGKSLFEKKNVYLEHSPVLHAENVSTPLLSWTGKEDTHVNALQSHEFYFALRRLNKEHIMLAYPHEGHNIRGMLSQEDLTLKVQQWFDRYLKDGLVQNWMKPRMD